ncbi:hypothetical protein DENSPDRAFT_855316 [Dentipellis sp. KUC8613]|nr:hypothetical protein DENSPDRAFT_855316 [Dentipellis sp. KUC8613]
MAHSQLVNASPGCVQCEKGDTICMLEFGPCEKGGACQACEKEKKKCSLATGEYHTLGSLLQRDGDAEVQVPLKKTPRKIAPKPRPRKKAPAKEIYDPKESEEELVPKRPTRSRKKPEVVATVESTPATVASTPTTSKRKASELIGCIMTKRVKQTEAAQAGVPGSSHLGPSTMSLLKRLADTGEAGSALIDRIYDCQQEHMTQGDSHSEKLNQLLENSESIQEQLQDIRERLENLEDIAGVDHVERNKAKSKGKGKARARK